MGNVYLLNKAYAQAVDFYGRALAQKSDDVNSRINYARALYEMGDYTNASEAYKLVVSINPGLALRYGYLARATDSVETTRRSWDTGERTELNAWSVD